MEPGQYQQLEVGERLPVRRFVEGEGLEFSPGRAFYQLTKKETVQDYKLVLARRKADGALVAGEELRTVLNIPKKSAKKVTVDLENIPDFDIFVQSTSYNRVLLPGTKLLYKLEGEATDKAATATKRKPDTKDDTAADGAAEKKSRKNVDSDPVVEVVFSFDTTGSMYACLAEVRRGVAAAVRRLRREVAGIRLGVVAHGDYCDARTSYVTKLQDFTCDEDTLCRCWAADCRASNESS